MSEEAMGPYGPIWMKESIIIDVKPCKTIEQEIEDDLLIAMNFEKKQKKEKELEEEYKRREEEADEKHRKKLEEKKRQKRQNRLLDRKFFISQTYEFYLDLLMDVFKISNFVERF